MEITFKCGATAKDVGSIAMACKAHKCDNAACQADCKATAEKYKGFFF